MRTKPDDTGSFSFLSQQTADKRKFWVWLSETHTVLGTHEVPSYAVILFVSFNGKEEEEQLKIHDCKPPKNPAGVL